MEQLEIKKPFELTIAVIEKDDTLPSFKTALKCRVNHPTGILIYEANDIWFECTAWEGFIDNLSHIDEVNGFAALANMSDYFSFQITPKNGELFVELKCKEPFGNIGGFDINYIQKIDPDTLDYVRTKFREMDIWWK